MALLLAGLVTPGVPAGAHTGGTGRGFANPESGPSAAEVWLESDKLDGPNGLFLDGGTLMVAAYGQDPDGDGPAARAPGRLLAVDLATKAIHPLGDMAPLGNLDGLEKLGSDWIV